MIVGVFILLIVTLIVGIGIGQLIERDRSDLPRATATWRQRRAWRKERLSLRRIPNSWRRA